ncbi:MAG: biotin--[acetyl-CoA-carboxylase] ligase [Bacteroidota bacterium]
MKVEVIYLERTGSTNTYAQQLLKDSLASEGSVILAAEQTEGRGQGSNAWHSGPGLNLTFSLVLEPRFLQPHQQFALNKSIACAVLQTLRKDLPATVKSCIKWPNDIYASGKKIAGILIEHSIMGSIVKHSVIGIGINLNQTRFPKWVPNPVSLKQLTSKDYDIRDMLQKTCSNIEYQYGRLKRGEFEAIDNDYTASLCGLGKILEFTAGGKVFSGSTKGVDDLGRLCVLTADGELRKFSHGEIGW